MMSTEEKLKQSVIQNGLVGYGIEYRESLGNAWMLRSPDGSGWCFLGYDEQSALISILAFKAQKDRGSGEGKMTSKEITELRFRYDVPKINDKR